MVRITSFCVNHDKLTEGMYLSRADGDAIGLVQQSMAFIAAYEGTIPGTTAVECGNYLEHDLSGALAIAKRMARVLAGWTTEQLAYLQ